MNTCTLGNSTRSVSTQSDQFEDDDWVIIDDSRTRNVSTQTDEQLGSGQKTEMLRKMRRAQSYELQQAEIRCQNLRASYESVKKRYELMLKSQRLAMNGKMDLLEAKLKAQKMESNCKLRYFTK